MQREQIPIVNAMLRTSYRDTVFRSIALMLMVRVGQRFENMSIEGGEHMTAEQKVQLKKQYAKELLKDSRVKKDIDLDIDDISKQKSDMVYEIMRQHGLHNNVSESTYMHDQLSLIFDQCLWNVRVCVKRGNWDALGF